MAEHSGLLRKRQIGELTVAFSRAGFRRTHVFLLERPARWVTPVRKPTATEPSRQNEEDRIVLSASKIASYVSARSLVSAALPT